MAIISTIFEEIAIVVIVLWGLPKLGAELPLAVLIALMVAWAAYSVTVFRIGSRALKKKPVIRLPVVGSRGKVVTALSPEGMIRIKNELWVAKSDGSELSVGDGVIVVEQEGLKLVVRPVSAADDDPEADN